MKPRRHSQSPVIRFLGDDAGIGGPFALLGLSHSIRSDDEIYRACQRRLRQVDCHPHRATPDADEVRLALYAAAKQLLDDELREQLIRRWPEGKAVDMPKAWKARPRTQRLSDAFVQRARMIIASSGGWNQVARKRLAHLARLNRVSAIEIIHAISPSHPSINQRQQAQTNPARNNAAVDSSPRQEHGSLGDDLKSWWSAYALLGLLSIALGLTIVFNPSAGLGSDGQSRRASTNMATSSSTPAAEPSSATHGGASPARTEFSHYTAIAHELDQIAARARSDPHGSAARFSEIYPRFLQAWTEFPQVARERSARHISEFVDRFSQSGGVEEQIAQLVMYPDREPRVVMMTAAVLDVILSTPGLPTETRDVIWGVRDQVSTAPFQTSKSLDEAIVREAQELAVRQGNDDSQWWSSWMDGIQAVSKDDTQLRTRLLLDALSTRVRDQRTTSNEWAKISRLFVTRLDWRSASQARLWMIAQLNDLDVPTARVAALTKALAESSAASGVDIRMVLMPTANNAQRVQIAEQYQQAWFTEHLSSQTESGPNQSDSGLIERLKIAVEITGPRMDQEMAMKNLVELARLNSAAWLQVSGDSAAAGTLMIEADNPNSITPDRKQYRVEQTDRDNDIAEEAINSKSSTELQSVLSKLVRDDGPGVNTAHALVHLATRPADKDIRDTAKQMLVRFKTSPSVLIALDYALTTTRATIRLEDLGRSVTAVDLPDRSSPRWMTQAHAVVLSLLADGLSQGRDLDLDHVQSELTRLYPLRGNGVDHSQSDEELSEIAESLVVRLRVEIASHKLSGDLIQDRLEALSAVSRVRFARSKTPIQSFYAYQQELFLLRAMDLEMDIPGTAPRIEQVRSELHNRINQSRTIYEQVAHTERALAELWLIELELKGEA